MGPRWRDGYQGEKAILRSCYRSSLELAEELQCDSIAFPLISSGTYGFPKDEALNIALEEIRKFLMTHEMEVILVVFDRTALELSESLVGGIEQYIDDHSEHAIRREEYGSVGLAAVQRREAQRRRDSCRSYADGLSSVAAVPEATAKEKGSDDAPSQPGILPDVTGKSLEEVLGGTGPTFQKRLFELIDASGMDDVAVYKKANIDRKVFSSIRCKADYKPKKKTAVAFAIALELDLPTTQDLLSRAGIAFSNSSVFDLIVAYFIENKKYDIFELNAVLFKYGQPILG